MSRLFNIFSSNENDKKPSLPNNWPYPSADDILERPKRLIDIGVEQRSLFNNNFVKTSKYEIYNFLPKFLMEEFNPKVKFANCYFLIIACLQAIPAISNTNGIPTTLLPLLFVVFVDGIFQIIEDLSRHKADTEANSSIALKYNIHTHDFIECKWFEIKVGDYIKVLNRNTIPADLIILSVHEKEKTAQGLCYVETKSLDGETNLKIRSALPLTLKEIKKSNDLLNIRGLIEMEHPNNLIHSFSGIIEITEKGRDAIQSNNLLLRGCVLRNTEWVIGIVVNTGHDTKIMMSASATKNKTSLLESIASTQIRRIMMLLALICIGGAIGQTVWNQLFDVKEIIYLDWNPNPGGNWFIAFFYFFLLHATFIPVSLYVSMTVCRYFQSMFMNSDLEMYYEKTDTPALVRTMTLNEELGQISHIFSDKTGTLTCNIMDFRKMSINGISYGLGITEIGKASWKLQGKTIPADVLEGERLSQLNSVPHVAFFDPIFETNKNSEKEKFNIARFLRILALCHDSIPERTDNKIIISASNPDDDAIVCAAKYFGYEFIDREEKVALLQNHHTKKIERYTILETISFTSKRKRLSVLLKDEQGKIWLYSKGADTVMWDRLIPGQNTIVMKTTEHLDKFGTEGLRCLIVGYKECPIDVFNAWYTSYHTACTDLTQLEKQKKGLPNDIEILQDQIETGLICAGCTGIEDKLQNGVPDTIAALAKAGINIWVLTGDKEETALNIAVACNLVQPDPYMVKVIINKRIASTVDDIKKLLKNAGDEYDNDPQVPRALIIDGPILLMAFNDEELKDQLLLFTIRCKAVVCCRVSPDQKKEIVGLVKYNVPDVRTLAIGDGANDVAMIQAAHIGVGIKGEEGVQAVNSSDYAIAQFKFLKPLLMKHGRYNYIRMSALVCFMFYKNVFMSMAQWWFNFFNGFSGTKYYIESGIQLFNLTLTGLPIILYAIYDRDLISYIYRYPQLYTAGINNENFTVKLL